MTAEDVLYDAANYLGDELDGDDLVDWAPPRPFTVTPAAATGTLVAAFALGVLTAVGVLALMGRIED
ncbi:hypothetical protein [uncultured Brevundimonas sp.]|uniref:hypothetical protein n=1 Tax=uncultured Brevundimonas sp. TaxID=213418 RepID=UPI0030ED6654|tara:strand:+ start:348 stop:548 length:201 start_codon:yes stop_codon:yes gene_type:complete